MFFIQFFFDILLLLNDAKTDYQLNKSKPVPNLKRRGCKEYGITELWPKPFIKKKQSNKKKKPTKKKKSFSITVLYGNFVSIMDLWLQ